MGLFRLGMKHQRFKLIIFYSKNNPVPVLTYFTAWSNFATSATEGEVAGVKLV